jgi:hypothetical protein
MYATRQRPPSPPSRWRWIYGVVGIVLTALAGVGFMVLFLSTYEAGMDNAYDPSVDPTPAAEATTIPEAVAGRWSGTVETFGFDASADAGTWRIDVDLTAGATGGRLVMVDRACSVELTDLYGRVDDMRFQVEAGPCLPQGTVTLLRRVPQRLDFEWMEFPNSDHQAGGPLTRP